MAQHVVALKAGTHESDRVPLWNDPAGRGRLYQAAILGVLVLAGYYLFTTTMANLEKQSIATGFGFLAKESGFEITEALLPHSAVHSYANALMVGLANTLKVSAIGIVLTIVLGTLIGVARLSSNWLLSKISAVYIETLRNVPILLQLFFWYAIFYENLPPPRRALSLADGLFLCNRGLIFAVPEPHPAHGWMAAAFALACLAVFFLRRFAVARQERTGQPLPVFRLSVGVLLGLPAAAWYLAGAPTAMDVPHLAGFNFKGGLGVSPEFTALLMGLVLYTAAFVAEIVRAGIQSVSSGQREAAMALGLKPGLVLSLIILPQALRVIIPPLTGQMLDLTKNSSLAIAIGFPDFVSVANTTINQTGQAIEGVALIMAVYLFLSLTTSAFMNWTNGKMALVQR